MLAMGETSSDRDQRRTHPALLFGTGMSTNCLAQLKRFGRGEQNPKNVDFVLANVIIVHDEAMTRLFRPLGVSVCLLRE